ncbi:hypothetical protein TruAng_007089 [Truncatella angustata]|nr:hypothetical protein TruAng_007089 [Truncatella angustata]
MSRLPDSFLPSGALQDPNEHALSLAGLVNGHPGSVISPLSLPKNANQHLSYFDDRRSHIIGHPFASPAQAQQQRRYLSPQRGETAARDPRSASLPPASYSQQQQVRSGRPGFISPSLSPLNENPEQASLHLQRVLTQNRRLLENWEAERAHLEANRSRAEEIYKEERAIMDEDRMMWAEKEAQYLARIAELERENATLRASGSSRDSPVAAVAGSSGPSGRSAVQFRAIMDSASPIATPILGLGHTMPVSHPFEPLDPRMQSASPQANTPNDGPETQENIPSIDVQEVHPDLEGIPLKPTAIKKTTFTDEKPPSPPLSGSNVTGPNSNLGSPNSRSSKATPAEVTKETLQAPEGSRLTMHAGHTPNHSLSAIPTAHSTNATNTAGSSGASTPTRGRGQSPPKGQALAEVESTYADGQYDFDAVQTEAVLEPSENDPELKGPLSLRNQQAFDEIFLAKVAAGLEESIRSDDATPTVLKHGVDEPEVPSQQPATITKPDEANQTEELEEVPLKFKTGNTNFGAPLGTLHGF